MTGEHTSHPSRATTAGPTSTPSDLETRTMAKAFARLVPLMFLMVFVNYLDRINLGFAQLQMSDDLDLGAAAFGLAGSAFFVGYMIFEVPGNIVLQRVGARRWIARILISWGLVAAATAFVNGAHGLYLARFGLGVMEAGFLPGLAFYVTAWFPQRYRARAIGGYIVGSAVAAVLGGPISTTLMSVLDETAGLHGWQWMFLVEGAFTVVLGLASLKLLIDRPRLAPWLEPEEATWLEETLETERAATDQHRTLSFRRIFSDSRVWLLSLLFGSALVGIYGLQLWLPQILEEFGDLGDVQIGFLSAIPPLLGVLGTFVVSRRSDRTGDRKRHLAVVYAASTVAIVLSAVAPQHLLAYTCLCLFGMFVYAGNPLFWSISSSLRTGADGAATIAVVNTIAQFGGVLAPTMIGFVKASTGSFTIALLVIGGFLLIATVLAVLLPDDPQVAQYGGVGEGSNREGATS